eukprot:scaffold6251_cov52-Attheya_sp.AAC.3
MFPMQIGSAGRVTALSYVCFLCLRTAVDGFVTNTAAFAPVARPHSNGEQLILDTQRMPQQSLLEKREGCGRKSSWTVLNMATWSDSRAVKEYQDFLASGKQEIDVAEDGPCVIVTSNTEAGASPRYQGLVNTLVALGMGNDVILETTSGQDLPETLGGQESYPIYMALPPFELKEFLKNGLPDQWKSRRDDFCFFSGTRDYGCIEQDLKDCGMCRDETTQLLLGGFTVLDATNEYANVNMIDDCSVTLDSMDAQGGRKYAGESSACGKWSGAFQARLDRNAVRCKRGFYREWRRDMWERTIYDAVFNLVGSVRKMPTSLGEAAEYYEVEASDMMWEISGALRGGKAVTLLYGFEDRLFTMADRRGRDQPCALVDDAMYPYIHGEFLWSKMHVEYVAYAKDEFGAFPNTILPNNAKKLAQAPIIRQGNLRADGVI